MGKECGTVTEQFFSQQYTPMIPILKQNIQNPKNIVPEVAASGGFTVVSLLALTSAM
jgi:hypothetical protein